MGDRRIVVVGAGPAGVRAAEALVRAGLKPIVLDEHRRDGGQIYRRQPEGFGRSYETLYGTEASRAAALHRAFEGLAGKIVHRASTLAWNFWDNEIYVVSEGRSARIAADAFIFCSGATDRVMPIKGWDFAGTYTLGGAQIALKSQGCAIGERTAFVGTGPLLYLAAKQYAAAGAKVAAVLDTSRFGHRVRSLPGLMARPATLLKGVATTAKLVTSRIRVETGIVPLEIHGSLEGGVTGVAWKTARGENRRIECSAVAIGCHLRPETQLAEIARCDFQFDEASRLQLPVIDADGRSTTKGVYLAGDGAMIAGADAAEISGQLAALAALADLDYAVDLKVVRHLRKQLATQRRFSRSLQQAFPWPHQLAKDLPDETVVCRCEMVSAGDVRSAVRELGAREINRAKAFSRCGMGRCQGRYCGAAAAEVIAAESGRSIADVGRLRAQAPVKPLPGVTVEEAS